MLLSYPARRPSPLRSASPAVRLRSASAVLGTLVCAMLAAIAAPAPAAAQGMVKAVHGEWEIRCDTPPGAQGEQCLLLQSVKAEDRPNVGITVVALKTADQKSRLLRVLAPLGVILPKGVRLVIDGQEATAAAAPFVRCLPNGCLAEQEISDATLQKLKTGRSAVFIFFETEEEGIGMPLSLEGFAQGFDQLR